MKAYFWHSAVLLGMAVATIVAQDDSLVLLADLKVDCGRDSVTLRWGAAQSQMDTSLLRLGGCYPNSISAGEAMFQVEFSDCNFSRLVTGDTLMYMNELIYMSGPKSQLKSFSHPVVCAYERPADWAPRIFDPVFHTYGEGDLVFHMELMKDDFSGPHLSWEYPLGSFIHVSAAVEQMVHQPLLLLLEECVATTTPEQQSEGPVHPIITNKGCLVASKNSNSKFEPRPRTSEIRLSLQAFKFAVGKEVYIHCSLLAWDPSGLDTSKKACHYVEGHGWVLLDDPYHSTLCGCCDSSCEPWKTSGIASGKHGSTQNAVLIGPLVITDNSPA
ncbi:zona pellucida sperm-binding protein 3-like [Oncorhynchus masou masou]|uniref:zona pellucida sperm-binding protein 3-like n=1 Tax=Oncorhynchus masou masou TaxID=90313 RepID=UPI0031837538